jgi:proline iminopeptidase
VSTLIPCGRHDEMGPACAGLLHRVIANADLQIFEQSAHVAPLEEPDAYLRVVRLFLRRTTTLSK